MARTFTPKVITSNSLILGDAVWFTKDGLWSPDLQAAQVFHDEVGAHAALKVASSQEHLITGAYLADVQQDDSTLKPVHFREDFRTKGPSNYPHGKQEQ